MDFSVNMFLYILFDLYNAVTAKHNLPLHSRVPTRRWPNHWEQRGVRRLGKGRVGIWTEGAEDQTADARLADSLLYLLMHSCLQGELPC